MYKLSKRQSELLAVFLKHRFELSKVIRDEKVLDTVLFSEESTRKIRLECGLSVPHYQVLMSQLRKLNIIDNKTIRKQLIPSIEEDSKEFRLTFHMIFDDTKR